MKIKKMEGKFRPNPLLSTKKNLNQLIDFNNIQPWQTYSRNKKHRKNKRYTTPHQIFDERTQQQILLLNNPFEDVNQQQTIVMNNQNIRANNVKIKYYSQQVTCPSTPKIKVSNSVLCSRRDNQRRKLLRISNSTQSSDSFRIKNIHTLIPLLQKSISHNNQYPNDEYIHKFQQMIRKKKQQPPFCKFFSSSSNKNNRYENSLNSSISSINKIFKSSIRNPALAYLKFAKLIKNRN